MALSMNELEHKILHKFKMESSRELSTSEVVRGVLSEESRWVKEVLSGVRERAQLVVAKRKKGQLHRKVLYYLNKLKKEESIIQTKVTGKGEKYFVLNVQKTKENERTFFESPQVQLVTPIEGYEKQGFIHREEGGWSNRVSSIMMDASKFSGIFKLQNAISECFSEVSDAVGVYRFEVILEEATPEAIKEGLRKLDLEAKDFNREVCLLVNVNQVQEAKLKYFVEDWMRVQPEKVKIIWRVDSGWLESHQELGGYILKLFASHHLVLFMDNNSLQEAPSFLGKTGVHRMSKEEWENFLKSGMEMGVCAVCALSLDVERFFNKGHSFQEFRLMVQKAAKALFLGNWAIRNQGRDHLALLSRMNEGSRAGYHLGSNQLRFTHFPVKGVEADHFLSLLESCRFEVARFVKVQETILKSCGMPLRFKIALGVGEFAGSNEELVVSKVAEFFKPEFQEYIRRKERLAKIFAGKSILRWITPTGDQQEWLNQIRYVLDHVNIPFFSLSFGEEKGIIKLTSFLR